MHENKEVKEAELRSSGTRFFLLLTNAAHFCREGHPELLSSASSASLFFMHPNTFTLSCYDATTTLTSHWSPPLLLLLPSCISPPLSSWVQPSCLPVVILMHHNKSCSCLSSPAIGLIHSSSSSSLPASLLPCFTSNLSNYNCNWRWKAAFKLPKILACIYPILWTLL